MKKIRYQFKTLALMVLLIGLLPSAHAGKTESGEYFHSKENPHEQFNVTKLNSDKITVSFLVTQNVAAICNAESKKRGYGGFKNQVEACSFWDASKTNNKCTIVLPEVTNFHTIGHEIRHCMQGSYHQ